MISLALCTCVPQARERYCWVAKLRQCATQYNNVDLRPPSFVTAWAFIYIHVLSAASRQKEKCCDLPGATMADSVPSRAVVKRWLHDNRMGAASKNYAAFEADTDYCRTVRQWISVFLFCLFSKLSPFGCGYHCACCGCFICLLAIRTSVMVWYCGETCSTGKMHD